MNNFTVLDKFLFFKKINTLFSERTFFHEWALHATEEKLCMGIRFHAGLLFYSMKLYIVISPIVIFNTFIYSQPSLSRLRLSRITAYLEEKI